MNDHEPKAVKVNDLGEPFRGSTWRGPLYLDRRPLHLIAEGVGLRAFCSGKSLHGTDLDDSRPTCKHCLRKQAGR